MVKTLTGIDTDRWEEEKRRGITMDLGFASLHLGDLLVSLVDVPGHEDFVRNMVAGATGIDAALLVVAADEGFMPQTLEHLSILEFLNVPVGIPVITKTDLVEDDWLELVTSEVVDRLGESSVSWLEPVKFSAVTEEGVEELKKSICSLSRESATDERELFRMPVDRSFTVAGTGTVVTGTVWSGTVRTGDTVFLLPRDAKARIRGIQTHGAESDAAHANRRTALALTGVDRDGVGRGDVVVGDKAWRATDSIDVAIELTPGAKPLGQRSRVRVHLGTAEVMARVTPAEGDIVPGGSFGARLRLESPVVARWGDKGVVRSYSPMATIGGITVVDPFPPQRPRRPVAWKEKGSEVPQRRVMAFLGAHGEILRDELVIRLGFGKRELDWVAEPASGLVEAGELLLSASAVEARIARVSEELLRFHRERSAEPGILLEQLRPLLGPGSLGEALLVKWASDAGVELIGAYARIPGFEPKLGPEAAELAGVIKGKASFEGFQGVGRDQLVRGQDTGLIDEILGFLVRSGELTRVGSERYYTTAVMTELIGVVVTVASASGEVSPADLREKTGLTRKYLIPLLEWMDGEGITTRKGDVRLLGPKGERIAAGPVDKS